MSTELAFDAHFADRVIALEGAHNFRRIEGWQTDDGRVLRPGRLYRASTLHTLSDSDLAALTPLNIGHIVDLRSEGERDRYASRWSPESSPTFWSGAEGSAEADLSQVMRRDGAGRKDFAAAMAKVYSEFPFHLAGALRDLFRSLLAIEDEAAVLIHCAAGKDRTGFVVAMLLRALGIREEDVVADYLLTNATFARAFSAFSAGHGLEALEDRVPGAAATMLGAHAGYLAAADAVIHKTWGTADAYLRDVAALNASDHAELQARFLTPPA